MSICELRDFSSKWALSDKWSNWWPLELAEPPWGGHRVQGDGSGCQLSVRGDTALGLIRRKEPPTRSAGVAHLVASSEPRLLRRPKFFTDRLDVSDQAQEKREIDPLVFGRVVDRDRTSFEQDRAKVGNRNTTATAADSNILDLRPMKCLGAAGYLNGVELTDREP